MSRIIILVLLISLAGCKEVFFTDPQPKGRKKLTSVPVSLQGKYLTVREDGEPSKDTVVISSNGYRFGYFDPGEQVSGSSSFDKGVLSDSLILKAYKGYYFLNAEQDPAWLVRVLRPQKNGDILYMTPEQEGVDFKDYVKKLSAEIRIDSSMVDGEMVYRIDPSPRQIIALIEKGFFTSTVLKKIK
jgi:hypothetical protein